MKLLRLCTLLLSVSFLSLLFLCLRYDYFRNTMNMNAVILTDAALVVVLSSLCLHYVMQLRHQKKKKQEEEMLPTIAVHIKRIDQEEVSDVSVVMHDILILGRNLSITHVSFPNELTVSSQHCRLVYDNQIMYLEDLHSKNGTYIDGRKLEHKVRIQSGITVFLGGIGLQIYWKELN